VDFEIKSEHKAQRCQGRKMKRKDGLLLLLLLDVCVSRTRI
jgi:hypothetical protein